MAKTTVNKAKVSKKAVKTQSKAPKQASESTSPAIDTITLENIEESLKQLLGQYKRILVIFNNKEGILLYLEYDKHGIFYLIMYSNFLNSILD